MKRPASVTALAVLAMITGVVQLIASLGYFGVSFVTTPWLFGTVASEIPLLVMGLGFVSRSERLSVVANSPPLLSGGEPGWYFQKRPRATDVALHARFRGGLYLVLRSGQDLVLNGRC